MPDFSISRESLAGGIELIKVSGFLDAHTFEQLEETVNGIFAASKYKIIVDLTHVDYISSAGAGVFIASLSESEENGGKIVLLNPTKGVLDVFDLLGLTQIFVVVNDRQEAVNAFAA
jgi:anti-sigma B factor antagonist